MLSPSACYGPVASHTHTPTGEGTASKKKTDFGGASKNRQVTQSPSGHLLNSDNHWV